jgi:hypothetical protein
MNLSELSREELVALLEEVAEEIQVRNPKYTRLYVHTTKDEMRDAAKALKLSDAALANFQYAGAEIELELVVDYDGVAKVISFNNVRLPVPVEI